MKISIFPQAKPLPKGKEEKSKESRKTSTPYTPETVEFQTEDDLIRIVTNYAWSNSVFSGVRRQENFVSCDLLVLDIDEGMTIDEAYNKCEEAGIMVLCVPTTSHTPENHRFRLLFPLSRTITKPEVFIASMEDLVENFPMADPHCTTNYCCFYFAGTLDDGFFIEGDLLEPVMPPEPQKRSNSAFSRNIDISARVLVEDDIKEIITELYGEERTHIPESVDHFIRNASTGLSGTWVCDLNNFAFVLSLQGIDYDTIYDLVLYLAPRGELTKRDEDTIKRAVNDGIKAREEEE